MIFFAVKNLARSAVCRPASPCLRVLSSCSLRSLHVIPDDTRLLDTKSSECLPYRSISLNIFEKISKKPRLNYSGTILYEGIADKLNYQYFFDEFHLEDTFLSWFLITELHVWMLMLRLMQEGDDGTQVRNFMVGTMWQDVQTRSRKLGHSNASLVRKQVSKLSEEFNASIVGYDEAVQASDSILAAHVWRRFFSSEKVDPLLLEKLVHYIRRQLYMLSHVAGSDLINMSPRFNWEYV